jgi:hypothetical protein
MRMVHGHRMRGQVALLRHREQAAFPKAPGPIVVSGSEVSVRFFARRVAVDFPSGALPPSMYCRLLSAASFSLAIRAFPSFGASTGQFGLSRRRPGSARDDAGESAKCAIDFAIPVFPKEPERGALVDSPLRSLEVKSSFPNFAPPMRREGMV